MQYVPGHPGVQFDHIDTDGNHHVTTVHLVVDGLILAVPIPIDVQGLTNIVQYCIPKVDQFRDEMVKLHGTPQP